MGFRVVLSSKSLDVTVCSDCECRYDYGYSIFPSIGCQRQIHTAPSESGFTWYTMENALF